MTENCACDAPGIDDMGDALAALGDIRRRCPALHAALLPDRVWPSFHLWHGEPDSVAMHCSVVLLALMRGYLSRLTAPVHRFLLLNGKLDPKVRRQYQEDLTETWMQRESAVERHRKSRMFRGRLAELQFALWLEEHGWSVTGLEALRKGPDVEATSSSKRGAAFEVKFIGTEDDDFKTLLRSIAGENAGGSVSAYNGVNYLLFRLFEAARQLEGVPSRRVAVAIVEDLTWWRVDLQLKKGWVDWSQPRFLYPDPDWETFIAQQERRYPNLLDQLAPTLLSLDDVWVLRESAGFNYVLEYDVPLKAQSPS